jgi:hypothetical protein
MNHVFYDPETSLISFTIKGATEAILKRQTLPFIIAQDLPDDLFYLCVDNGALKLRPYPPMCPEGLSAGQAWDWSDMPEGTSIEVSNGVGESITVTEFDEPLTFTDPGSYIVSVTPPAPYLDHVYSVEIQNA